MFHILNEFILLGNIIKMLTLTTFSYINIILQSYVIPEKKDEKYWEKRNKNNVAARRSREARRLKENQISLRTAYLEQENASLKSTVQSATVKQEQLLSEKKILLQKLKRYESMSPFLSGD